MYIYILTLTYERNNFQYVFTCNTWVPEQFKSFLVS